MPIAQTAVNVTSPGGEFAGRLSTVKVGGGAFTAGGNMGAELIVVEETANDGKTPNPVREVWRFDHNVPGYAEQAVASLDPAMFFDTYEEAEEYAESYGERLDKIQAAIKGL